VSRRPLTSRCQLALGGLLVRPVQRRALTVRFTGDEGSSITQKAKAPPPNLRLIAGDPARRSYDPKGYDANKLTWRCQAPGHDDQTPELPAYKCGAPGIRGQINFPEARRCVRAC